MGTAGLDRVTGGFSLYQMDLIFTNSRNQFWKFFKNQAIAWVKIRKSQAEVWMFFTDNMYQLKASIQALLCLKTRKK